MIRDALYYGTVLGIAVFPVARDCRQPLTEHGYKDASADPDEIANLWRGREQANIAAAMGSVSGAFCLDVDVKGENGLAMLDNLERANTVLPPTWMASTPSGGRHLWFRQPTDRHLRNRVGFAPGLDVRTDGGSIALPPSRRKDGAYRWEVAPLSVPLADAPGWLLRLIDPPAPTRPPTPPIRVGSLDRLARYAASAVDGECRDLASMTPNTGRNLRLFQAAAKLGELVGAGIVPADVVESNLEQAAFDCGLTAEDGAHAVKATIKSGLNRGMANPREVAA